MKKKADILLIVFLLVGVGCFFWFNISLGDVKIGSSDLFKILTGGKVENASWSYIVESRLNRSLVAIFAGGALGISGLILQVFFRNPLAGPGVLGVTSGASLGVATVLLGGATMGSVFGGLSIVLAGVLGAVLVLLLLLFVSKYIRHSVTLLVAGLMFSYFTAAIVNILFLWANETKTREYVVWGLGSFEGLSNLEVRIFSSVIVVLLVVCFLLIKPLNALVTGKEYASSLGINISKTRVLIIIITGVLAAIVTVYCGPVGFIGIAVPQLIRVLVKSKNHAVILPIVFIAGAFLAIFADFIVRMSSNTLPLNTVTALIGAPIIIWIIIKMNARNAQI